MMSLKILATISHFKKGQVGSWKEHWGDYAVPGIDSEKSLVGCKCERGEEEIKSD